MLHMAYVDTRFFTLCYDYTNSKEVDLRVEILVFAIQVYYQRLATENGDISHTIKR